MFQPISNSTPHMIDVNPCFSAYFECRERDKPTVRYQVDLLESEGESKIYDKMSETWSKMGRGDTVTPISIFMIRLDG